MFCLMYGHILKYNFCNISKELNNEANRNGMIKELLLLLGMCSIGLWFDLPFLTKFALL